MSKRILIVEDQFIEAFDLQLILESNGCTVMGISHDATGAFEAIALEKPDLVCLDIFLRGATSGLEIAERLSAEGIGFIFISANTDQYITTAVGELKPLGYVSKPFQEQDVLPVIQKALYDKN